MNAREAFITLLNQAIVAYDTVCSEREAAKVLLAEATTRLEMCERENSHLRGELDEDMSMEVHPSHVMLPERATFIDGAEVMQTSCERCGFEHWWDDRNRGYYDDELSDPCQGHMVMQP